MKKTLLIVTILFIAVISTACINNLAVQELNNKAQQFMEQGDYEAAINRLEASLDLDNSIFETCYNLGVAYIKANKYDKAISILTKASEMKPEMADVYYSLAVAQDSYAQEILAYEDKPAKSEEMDEDSEEVAKESVNQIQNMSKEERKAMAIDLYNKSKISYQLYLDKSTSAKDVEEVTNQLKNIDEELESLSK